jgi:uncharacterized protein YecA (UPF0149 family)
VSLKTWMARLAAKAARTVGYGRTDVLGLNVKKDEPALNGVGRPDRTRHVERIGRNAPCPCGSGLRFKKCHGRDGWRRRAWERLRGFDDAS